jgi:hypothetical protein
MPTPHDTFREQLLDLSYGELGKREEKALRAHLETCAACRAELAQLEGTRGAMAALGQEPAPERGEAILLAAAREAARQRQVGPRPFLPAWLWGTSLSAVAAVAVALISYKLAQGPNAFQRHPVDELVPSSAPAEVASAPAAPEPPAPLARAEAPAEADALGGAAASGAGAPAERKAAAPAPAPRPSVAAAPRRERSAAEKARQAADGAPPAPRVAQAPAPAKPAAAPAAPQAHEKEAQAEGEQLAADEAGPGEAKGNAAARPGLVASAAPAAPASSATALAEDVPPPPAPLEDARRDQAAGAIGGASSALAEKREAPAARAKAMSRAAAAAEPEDAIARHQRLRVAGRLHTASAAYPHCAAEASRELDLDAQGRVVRYTRRGTHAGAPFQAELFYGEDGRLGAVRYQSQGRVHELRPGGADGATAGIPAFALEPRQADRAGLDAPPRCGG